MNDEYVGSEEMTELIEGGIMGEAGRESAGGMGKEPGGKTGRVDAKGEV